MVNALPVYAAASVRVAAEMAPVPVFNSLKLVSAPMSLKTSAPVLLIASPKSPLKATPGTLTSSDPITSPARPAGVMTNAPPASLRLTAPSPSSTETFVAPTLMDCSTPLPSTSLSNEKSPLMVCPNRSRSRLDDSKVETSSVLSKRTTTSRSVPAIGMT